MRVFKLWGQLFNIREQQDAFEFTNVTDQIDEHLKVHYIRVVCDGVVEVYVRCLNYGVSLFNIRVQQDEFRTNLTDQVVNI